MDLTSQAPWVVLATMAFRSVFPLRHHRRMLSCTLQIRATTGTPQVAASAVQGAAAGVCDGNLARACVSLPAIRAMVRAGMGATCSCSCTPRAFPSTSAYRGLDDLTDRISLGCCNFCRRYSRSELHHLPSEAYRRPARQRKRSRHSSLRGPIVITGKAP